MKAHRTPCRVASYQHAINWIAENDDTGWLNDTEDGSNPSVTAALVADLFGRTTDEVAKDLRRALDPRPGRGM